MTSYSHCDLAVFDTEGLEEASFTKSQFGNAMLVDRQGFKYVQNGSSAQQVYWRCIYHWKQKGSCPGKAVTRDFYITKKTEHLHEPNVPIVATLHGNSKEAKRLKLIEMQQRQK